MDTGSSDLWVNVPTSKFCRYKEDCSITGTFNPKASSTEKLVNHDFKIKYADDRGASGDYVTDDLQFSGHKLKEVQFGLGLVSSSRIGLIGIGYPIQEAYVINKKGKPFPNLPQILKNEGLINSQAYSLWLNDRKASHGSLLFGGVDTAKFHGTLTTLPIVKKNGRFEHFSVNLTGIHFTNDTGTIPFASGKSSLPAAVLLDSGSSLMTLAKSVAIEIYNTLKVVSYNDRVAVVDCGLGQENSTLDFSFATAMIRVPMSELVLPILLDQYGHEITTSDGTPLCRLGITYAAELTDPLVLGDTFLRSAYVVYDMTNNEVSIAPTNFNAVDSNIVEIGCSADQNNLLTISKTPDTSTTNPISKTADTSTTNPISKSANTSTTNPISKPAEPSTTNLPSSTPSAAPPPTGSGARLDSKSSAMHHSWSIFAALGGVMTAAAAASA